MTDRIADTEVDLSPEAAQRARDRLGPAEVGIGVLVLLLAVGTVWTVPRPTGDLYVALAAGRDILSGKLNQPDDWSFNTKGRIWVNQNWGTHLLYYGFYKIFGGEDGHLTETEGAGEIGLLLLKLLLLLTGAAFLTLACHRRGADWAVALIVGGAIIACGRSFIDLRPNLTTLMFVPVMLFLLHRTIDRPHRMWLAMGVFGLLWANLHGGFFFGLGVMGLWSACMLLTPMLERIEEVKGAKRKRHAALPGIGARTLWTLAGAAVALVLAVSMISRKGSDVSESTWLVLKVLQVMVVGLLGGLFGWLLGAASTHRYRFTVLPVLRRRWPYAAATAGAIVLAGVVTPFGLGNLFRGDTTNSPLEIWNLTHPVLGLVIPESKLWRSVIEWHTIFEASTRTFGTSWEFFTVLGVFSVLIPCQVIAKRIARRRLSLEDVVLVVGIVILATAVVFKAHPVWSKYAHHPVLRTQPGVPLLRGAWLAAMIVYTLIGLFAAVVAVLIVHDVVARRQPFAEYTPRRLGMLIFDVFMTTLGIMMAFNARRFIPLSLLLLAPMAARRLQWLLRAAGDALARARRAGGGKGKPDGEVPAAPLGGRLARSVPTILVGTVVFAVIALQARANIYRYLPHSPVVRNRSMLQNMIVYAVFPPGPMKFINDNGLDGRTFNEWRWEGYLRWYCPQLKFFLGGRAQQVYHLDTYKLQRRMLTGREHLSTLERMKIRWIVVPRNLNYTRLLQGAIYAKTSHWVPIYFDGENFVLANATLPECRRLINDCMKNRLTYRDRAVAELSRAYCFSCRVVSKPAEAMAALRESHKHGEILMAYAALSDLYKLVPRKVKDEIAYLEAENRHLVGVSYMRPRGDQVLLCRRWVQGTLAKLYTQAKRGEDAARVEAQLAETDALIRKLYATWR